MCYAIAKLCINVKLRIAAWFANIIHVYNIYLEYVTGSGKRAQFAQMFILSNSQIYGLWCIIL